MNGQRVVWLRGCVSQGAADETLKRSLVCDYKRGRANDQLVKKRGADAVSGWESWDVVFGSSGRLRPG